MQVRFACEGLVVPEPWYCIERDLIRESHAPLLQSWPYQWSVVMDLLTLKILALLLLVFVRLCVGLSPVFACRSHCRSSWVSTYFKSIVSWFYLLIWLVWLFVHQRLRLAVQELNQTFLLAVLYTRNTSLTEYAPAQRRVNRHA